MKINGIFTLIAIAVVIFSICSWTTEARASDLNLSKHDSMLPSCLDNEHCDVAYECREYQCIHKCKNFHCNKNENCEVLNEKPYCKSTEILPVVTDDSMLPSCLANEHCDVAYECKKYRCVHI